MDIRKATLDDMDLLIKLRIDYLLEEHKEQGLNNRKDIEIKLRDYFCKLIPLNGFIAFFAEENNMVCSTAFLSVVERPPMRATTSNLCGTIYNVYTYPAYRDKGIATKLMAALVAEAKLLNVSYLDLLATNAGTSLYKRAGFEEITKYTPMRMKI